MKTIQAIGFTGTRDRTTQDQYNEVRRILSNVFDPSDIVAHHGCCHGADSDFHDLCDHLGVTQFVLHPGDETQYRRFARSGGMPGWTIRRIKPYKHRNADIIRESDLIIATPKSRKEEMRGSGTWMTIRMARKAKKPLIIIWPDGTNTIENSGNLLDVLIKYNQDKTAQGE